MLSLSAQIGNHKFRVAKPVSNNHQLRGPGNHVDIDHAENLPFGLADIDISRADNLIHPRYSFSAIS